MPISKIKSSAIDANAITGAGIADGTVDTADLANGAVTSAKLDTNITVAGNITANTAMFAPSISGSSDTNTSLSFPGSDVVQLNNAATARYKFHNLNGASLFEVQASSTGGSGAGGAFLKFKGSNGTPVDIASIDGSMTNGSIGSESGILSFFTTDSGTNSEKVRIFSNGSMAVPNGISLGNGISAAASNLLDDYEEGTWTPRIRGSTGEPATLITGTGTYTKIGRLVTVTFDFNNTNTTGYTGTLSVDQLTFSPSSGYMAGGNAMFNLIATYPSGTSNICPYITQSSSSILFYGSENQANWTSLTHNAGTSGRYLIGSVTYEAT
jgi:hypothetical protein